MKKSTKRFSRLALAVVLAVMMLMLIGCTSVQISANINLNEDGTGSRTITASIAKNDLQDGYGSAYYYLSEHGDKLAKYLKQAYSDKVAGSEDWLAITVDDSGADWEVISLDFDFKSFEDYKTKLAALAYDKEAAASYTAPEFKVNSDGTATYTESTSVLTAIYKSIQATIMADTQVFDINSTKDGTATNDGSADFKSLSDFGVELMKPEFGDAMTVKLGTGKAATVPAADGAFTITGKYTVKAVSDTADGVSEDTADKTDKADKAANNTAEDTAKEAAVPKTGENSTLAIVSIIGLASCTVIYLASKKFKTQNR